MTEAKKIILKVVLVGDSHAGKTSLLNREAENTFNEQHLATIGVDFRIKHYKVGALEVKAQLWDTAGQERFRSIQKPYYRSAHAACLCFSLNDRRSFDNLMHWLDEMRGFELTIPIFLIGCKSDLPCEVPTDQILVFAEANQLKYMQTSAKCSEGVSECFKYVMEVAAQDYLIKKVFQKAEESPKKIPIEKLSKKERIWCC